MLKNLLVVACRNLLKDRSYTILNVIGLKIGITCSLFLLIYIVDELSYDRYHKNAENIYRVVSNIAESDNAFTWAVAPMPLAQELTNRYADVKNSARFVRTGRAIFKSDGKQFYESGFFLTDSTVFDMFNYQFIAGDPATALDDPFSIVLTEKVAAKYFDNATAAMGRSLQNSKGQEFKVTAVIEEVPANSHFRFDGLISASTRALSQQGWGVFGAFTYVELLSGQDVTRMQRILETIVKEKIDPIFAKRGIATRFELQRITDIHLHSKIHDEAEAGGDIAYIYIFGAVAVFVLVIACINYMNLATARSANRAREVGIRKVIGSQRFQLMGQFLAESVVVAMTATGLSLLVICTLLPAFNYLSGKSLSIAYFFDPMVALVVAGGAILVGIAGGCYPAFYLSGFNPVDVLKGHHSIRGGSNAFRKSLVIVQFSISIFMLIATMIVSDQLKFLRKKDLGFDKEHVVRLLLSGKEQRMQAGVLIDRLRQLSQVTSVGMASEAPGHGIGKLLLKVEGNDGKLSDRGVDLFSADYDFVTTLGMTIVEGRDFSEEVSADSLYAVLVNESMVKRMGWKNPIGKKFVASGRGPNNTDIEKRVVGVVKDYHQNSLYDEIEPLIISLSHSNNDNLFIRTSSGDITTSLAAIESAWKKVFPSDPFEYKFLDQDFNSQYRADEKRSYIFAVFSVLTMVIACLGLLGLAAFTAEQRTKEIGLRKIAGASVVSLVNLISRDFLSLILLAIVVAFPAAWFFTSRWLQHFAYRIRLEDEWPVVIIASALAVTVTLATIGYHVVRAATVNPVKALRG